MDWASLSRQIDGYCERTDFSFWAEPVNALTNLAFLAAAALVAVLAQRRGRLGDPAVATLLGLLTVIGIGSFLFHTLATAWAAMADSLPILLFILAYVAIALRRFFQLRRWQAGLGALGFLPFAALVGWLAGLLPLGFLGGSVGYLPALLALAGFGGWLAARRHPAGAWLSAAAGLFAVSLTFRSLDEPLCGGFPLGTHFAWHLLNGTLLGLVIFAVVRHGQRTAR